MPGGSERFRGVVLTGGASRRMGRDKAFIEIDGVAMVQRVGAELLAAGAEALVCVGGSRRELEAIGLVVVEDEFPGQGPLGGVITALRASAGWDVAVILSCDLVEPSAATIIDVVEALVAAPTAEVAVPLVDEVRQWTHAAWRVQLALGTLEAAFASGVRSLERACQSLVVATALGLEARDLRDADSPEDLPPGVSPGL